MERIVTTERGLARLRAEHDALKNERRPAIVADVARFRALGDLRENAEYHAAREELSMLDAKIAQLASKIAGAEVVPALAEGADTAMLGTRVTVQEEGAPSPEIFELVGSGEEDADRNWILTTSPLGQAFLTRRAGEVAVFQGPRRTIRYRILKVEPL